MGAACKSWVADDLMPFVDRDLAGQDCRAAAVAFFEDLVEIAAGTSIERIDKWHEVIGNPTYADAILDRLVHNAYRIDLVGDSLRRTRPKSAAKD